MIIITSRPHDSKSDAGLAFRELSNPRATRASHFVTPHFQTQKPRIPRGRCKAAGCRATARASPRPRNESGADCASKSAPRHSERRHEAPTTLRGSPFELRNPRRATARAPSGGENTERVARWTQEFAPQNRESAEPEAWSHHRARLKRKSSSEAASRLEGDVPERLNTESVVVHTSKSEPLQQGRHKAT